MATSKHEQWYKNPTDPRDSLTEWTEEFDLTSPDAFVDGTPTIELPEKVTLLDDPDSGAIYRILQSEDHAYKLDHSRVVNIGIVETSSRGSNNTIRQRLNSKFKGKKEKEHWVPLARKMKLTVQIRQFSKRGGNRNYRVTEGFLLKMFENKHGQIPYMNSQESSTKDKVYPSIRNVEPKRRIILPVKAVMNEIEMLDSGMIRKGDEIIYHNESRFETVLTNLFENYLRDNQRKFLRKSNAVVIHMYAASRGVIRHAGLGGTCWIVYFTDRFICFYNLVGRKRPEEYLECKYSDISIEEGLSERGLGKWIPGLAADDLFLTTKEHYEYKINRGISVGISESLRRLALISQQVKLES